MESQPIEGAFVPKPLLSVIKFVLAGCILIILVPIDYLLKAVVQSLACIGFGIAWTMMGIDRIIGLVLFIRTAGHADEIQLESDQSAPNQQRVMTKDQAVSMLVISGVFCLMGIYWIYVGAQGLR